LEKVHKSYDKGDFDEGLRHLDVILKDRNFIGALYNKALFLEKLGKHKEAIEWFNKILDIDPNNVFVLSSKGSALVKIEQTEQAIEKKNSLKSKELALFDKEKIFWTVVDSLIGIFELFLLLLLSLL
jgi:tetratricopeptide (TPR) repeat protein